MAQEAYRQGDNVFVVHQRRDGWVYGHYQKYHDTLVSFDQFRKWPEATFEAACKADGIERVQDEEFHFAGPEETTERLRAELAK